MEVIEFVQNIVFNKLNEEEKIINNIYITPEKNAQYPYLLIQYNGIENKNNIKNDLFFIDFSIKIFDKNINRDSVKLLNDTKFVQNKILSLLNWGNEIFNIKDIVSQEIKLNLFNEINVIWQSELKFNFLVEKK